MVKTSLLSPVMSSFIDSCNDLNGLNHLLKVSDNNNNKRVIDGTLVDHLNDSFCYYLIFLNFGLVMC